MLAGQSPAFSGGRWEPAVLFEDEVFTVEADPEALAHGGVTFAVVLGNEKFTAPRKGNGEATGCFRVGKIFYGAFTQWVRAVAKAQVRALFLK